MTESTSFLEPRPLPLRSTPTSPLGGEWGNFARFWSDWHSGAGLLQKLIGTQFLRASKALRKPLTMSGWTRPELPSGKGR
uniref:Uncharacterized protein n=1 Tax=Heterorhabditis bacteriophora TaxID=37862 RepID=A0A1I7XDN4_HETBA